MCTTASIPYVWHTIFVITNIAIKKFKTVRIKTTKMLLQFHDRIKAREIVEAFGVPWACRWFMHTNILNGWWFALILPLSLPPFSRCCCCCCCCLCASVTDAKQQSSFDFCVAYTDMTQFVDDLFQKHCLALTPPLAPIDKHMGKQVMRWKWFRWNNDNILAPAEMISSNWIYAVITLSLTLTRHYIRMSHTLFWWSVLTFCNLCCWFVQCHNILTCHF